MAMAKTLLYSRRAVSRIVVQQSANPNPRFCYSTEGNDKKPLSIATATGDMLMAIVSRMVRLSGSEEPEILINRSEEVIWEQNHKDVKAEKKMKKVTSPGFSFSAAGLLFPYHLGASQLLIEKDYIRDTTPLAGSSAGAIICAAVASGKSMQEAFKFAKFLTDDCRLKGTAFRLGDVLRDGLNRFLPEDIHIRCNGRVRVAITQLFWRPKGLIVDHFDSKEDLINALFTSSFIPGYLAPKPATMFRDRLCIDGALTLFMPPTSASKTVRICPFSANGLGSKEIDISPDCNPTDRATALQLFSWALEPADDEMLEKLYEQGYMDASAWADQNPVDSTVTEEEL